MKTTRSTSKRLIALLLTVVLFFGVFSCVCIYLDPICHFHKPLKGYDYSTVDNPFYMNDGIIRYYDYDGIITGSSMTENFKTSEVEQYFGGSFIKVPLSGSSFSETTDQLKRAYSRGKNPQYVIRSIDTYALLMGKDEYMHDLSQFDYVYNDKWYDDIKYLLNLEIFTKCTLILLQNRLSANETPLDFDAYCSWDYPTGKENVLKGYPEAEPHTEEVIFTPEDRKKVSENVLCNVVDIAREHPETTFICFFPPYSICNWDIENSNKTLRRNIETMKTAAEEMLKCPNIRLFGFDDHYDIICDLNNYKDPYHYHYTVNSKLLKYMSEDISRLTPENYLDYFDKIEKFYSGYDYAELHE